MLRILALSLLMASRCGAFLSLSTNLPRRGHASRRHSCPFVCLPTHFTSRSTRPRAALQPTASSEEQPPSIPAESQPKRSRRRARELWLPLKWRVLVLLVFQNAIATLLVRHTRTAPLVNGTPLYLSTAAVLVAEVLKLFVCVVLVARDEGWRGMVGEVRRVFTRFGDTMRMAVPSFSYGFQNLLYYVALSNLSATSYQLWSQSKTLFTAIFFVRILGKVLRWQQWVALGLLTIGVGAVQLEESAAIGSAAAAAGIAADPVRSVAVGIAAVLTSSMLSGFANIYFEKVLKQAECEFDESCELDGARTAPMSIWLRNVQLGVFAIPQAAVFLALTPSARATVATHGLLVGFTPLVWLSTVVVAMGGLLIASVVKHADNVLKTYATSLSILITFAVTTATTGVTPSPLFLQGMALVIGSMCLYNGVGIGTLLRGRSLKRRARLPASNARAEEAEPFAEAAVDESTPPPAASDQ
jgi:UDP-sugar transporter A1/2/3